jgi:hypothetical protein
MLTTLTLKLIKMEQTHLKKIIHPWLSTTTAQSNNCWLKQTQSISTKSQQTSITKKPSHESRTGWIPIWGLIVSKGLLSDSILVSSKHRQLEETSIMYLQLSCKTAGLEIWINMLIQRLCPGTAYLNQVTNLWESETNLSLQMRVWAEFQICQRNLRKKKKVQANTANQSNLLFPSLLRFLHKTSKFNSLNLIWRVSKETIKKLFRSISMMIRIPHRFLAPFLTWQLQL